MRFHTAADDLVKSGTHGVLTSSSVRGGFQLQRFSAFPSYADHEHRNCGRVQVTLHKPTYVTDELQRGVSCMSTHASGITHPVDADRFL